MSPPIFFCLTFAAAAAASSLPTGHVQAAAGSSGAQNAPSDVAGADVVMLVDQLQDPAFARRQGAAASLLKLPESSAPLLISLQTSAPPPVAERLGTILQSLRQRWFRERLRQLEQNVPEALPADFPCSKQLDQILHADSVDGPSATNPKESDSAFQSAAIQPDSPAAQEESRRLLLQLLKAEPEIFSACMYQAERLPELLEARSAALALECDGRQDRPFPTASALALMLVASQPELRLLRKTSSNISRPLEDPRFDRLTQEGQYRRVLRGVVGSWIRRPGIAADRPLIFAIRHRLPAGRELALKVLNGDGRGPQIFYACMCLAALGNLADIPLLERRLQSELVIWPPRGVAADAADSRLQVQSRDAAFAALIHLRKIPPDTVGLKLLPAWDTLYRIDSVGAVSDEIREQRLLKYRTAVSDQ
jgi:hypothetical protein